MLRAIEEGYFSRVGSNVSIKTNAKIIGTTSSDPARSLRKDLLYKFSSVVYLPPLRERREDVLRILELFKEKGLRLTHSAENFLKKAEFPGNMRMLFNVLNFLRENAEEVTLDKAVKAYETWLPEWKKEEKTKKAFLADREFEESREKLMQELLGFIERFNLNFRKIEEEFLSFLIEKEYKIEKISRFLGVSRATAIRLKEKIERRRSI